MHVILNSLKFQKIGPVNTRDNTARVEGSIQRRLLTLVKSEALVRSVYKAIRPSGSQRPRLYGLPKTHKDGGSPPTHPIYDWLCSA